MGYFVSFAVDGNDLPVDGDHVASNTGWSGFGDWAADLPEDHYPHLVYLAEEGACVSAESLAALESELARAALEKPGKPPLPIQGVARSLLASVRARPEGAVAMVVTDGTEGEDEGE